MTSQTRLVATLRGLVMGTTLLLVTPLAHAEPDAEDGAQAPRLAPASSSR
jgi:hypothetical protein